MATTSKSPLAVTLKQNRPFVSLQQEAFLSILRTASELSNTADKSLRQFDITQQQYNKLQSPGSNQPLIDRAIQGLYPPGSTYKPFVAAAALQTGVATENGIPWLYR